MPEVPRNWTSGFLFLIVINSKCLFCKIRLPGKTLKHNGRHYTRLDKLSNSASKQMHVTAHYHMGINYDEWKGHVFTAEGAFDNKHLIYDAQIGDFLNINA